MMYLFETLRALLTAPKAQPKEQDVLEHTLEWFKVSTPNPTIKNKEIQISCHLEEVAELLEALGLPHLELSHTVDEIRSGTLTPNLERREDILDALCDQAVTLTGVAHMLDMDVIGGLKEVNRSNFSKFDNEGKPIRNEFGKIIKGPNYSAPDLKDFV